MDSETKGVVWSVLFVVVGVIFVVSSMVSCQTKLAEINANPQIVCANAGGKWDRQIAPDDLPAHCEPAK